jgi:hypothetical protein
MDKDHRAVAVSKVVDLSGELKGNDWFVVDMNLEPRQGRLVLGTRDGKAATWRYADGDTFPVMGVVISVSKGSPLA